jgi:methyl-accepting chemotaxis protein
MGSSSQPLGTAGVGMNPDNLIKELTKRKITNNSKLWIIDNSGAIQISATKEEINKNISTILPADLVNQVTSKLDKSVISNVSWEGNKYEFAKMKIGTTDFQILVAAPMSELIELLNPIRTNTIIFGIVFFIITLILIYLLTKSIVDPLKRITNTANEFATGNLIPQIDESLIAREDEI